MLSLRFLRENAQWLSAGLLLAFASSFGQTFFISLFGGQYREELGLTDGEFGRVYTIATLGSALLLVNTGWIADRMPMRRLGVLVLVGLAGVCLLMSQVQNIWVFGLAIFGLRYAGQGMLSHIWVTATARWFVASRGRALAVASWGHPLGEGILPPLIAILLTQMEWRTVWIVCAAVLLCGLLPLYTLILKGERVPQGTETEGKTVTGIGGRHWTRAEVLRHPVFWLLVPALMASPLIGTSALFHQAHIAEFKGWTLVQFTCRVHELCDPVGGLLADFRDAARQVLRAGGLAALSAAAGGRDGSAGAVQLPLGTAVHARHDRRERRGGQRDRWARCGRNFTARATSARSAR